MAVTASTRLGITRWSAESDPVNRSQFDADHVILDNLIAIDVQDLLSNRPAPGVRGRFFSESSASAGLPGTTWREDGSSWRSVGSRIVAVSGTDVAQIVRGGASGSVDLAQWQSSAGGVLTNIGFDGRLFAPYLNVAGGILGSGASAEILARASAIGLLVQGSPSQSGNLTQWRDGAGTPLSLIDAAGGAQFPSLGVGTAPVGGTQTTIQSRAVGTIPLLVEGFGSTGTQTADLMQAWKSSAGPTVFRVAPDGGIEAGMGTGQSIFRHQTVFQTKQTGTGPVIVQGIAGITAAMLQLQNSAGTPLAGFDSNGALNPVPAVFVNSGYLNARLSVIPISASEIGLVVRGMPSQSGNLVDFQNSTPATVAGVDQYGRIYGSAGNPGRPVVWDIDAGIAATPPDTTSTGASFGSVLYGSQAGQHFRALNSSGSVVAQINGVGSYQTGNFTFMYSFAAGTPFSGSAVGDGALLLTGTTHVGDGTNYKPIKASAFTVSSAREMKQGIRDLTEPWDVLRRLRPVRYEYRGAIGTPRAGFIADEVAGVFPEAVSYDSNDKPDGIHYGEFVPLLVSALHGFDARLAALEQRLAAA